MMNANMCNESVKSLRARTKFAKITKFTKPIAKKANKVPEIKIKQESSEDNEIAQNITNNSSKKSQLNRRETEFSNVQVKQEKPEIRYSLPCSIPMAHIVKAIVTHADNSLEPARLDDYYSSCRDDERPRTPGRSLELLFEILSQRDVRSLTDWAQHGNDMPPLQVGYQESTVPQISIAEEENVTETNGLNAWWSNAIMSQSQIPTISIKEKPLDDVDELLHNNYEPNIDTQWNLYNQQPNNNNVENMPLIVDQEPIVRIKTEPTSNKTKKKRSSKREEQEVKIKEEIDEEFNPDVLNNIKQESDLEPRNKYSRMVTLRNRRSVKVTFVEPRPIKLEPIENKEEPYSPPSLASPSSPSSPEWNLPKPQKRTYKTYKRRK